MLQYVGMSAVFARLTSKPWSGMSMRLRRILPLRVIDSSHLTGTVDVNHQDKVCPTVTTLCFPGLYNSCKTNRQPVVVPETSVSGFSPAEGVSFSLSFPEEDG